MQTNHGTVEALSAKCALLAASLAQSEREADELRAILDSYTADQRCCGNGQGDAADRRGNRTTPGGRPRYTLGLGAYGAQWCVTLTINEAETMNGDELAADWPRLQPAVMRYCDSARDEAARRGSAASCGSVASGQE